MSFRQYWLNLIEEYQEYGKIVRNFKEWKKTNDFRESMKMDREKARAKMEGWKPTFMQRYDDEMMRQIAKAPKEES